MGKTGVENERIKELEKQLQIVKECCQMLIDFSDINLPRTKWFFFIIFRTTGCGR